MDKSVSVHRRILFLNILIFIIGAIFIARLFYLQVLKHDFYAAEALKEHTAKFVISASRGEIYARDGADKVTPLVLNEPTYTIFADPRHVSDIEKVVAVLRKIAGGNLVDGFEDGLRDTSRQYVILGRNVNKQQVELLEKEGLSGVGMQKTEKRTYLEGGLAAHILGFVNGEGEGQYGIEQGYNKELSGEPGLLKAITDVNGIPISIGAESVQTPAQNGKNIVLSIDRNIQNHVEQALKAGLERVKATKGSAVVINPNNGQILAMANLPSYNPSDYDKVEDYEVFQNRIISSPYEPGSVIKPFTIAAGLNEGVIQPDSKYKNTGSTQVADATIKNVDQTLIGDVTMTQVLGFSYNTGVVHVLRKLGGEEDINRTAKLKLYEYFTERFFFNKTSQNQLAGEIVGEVIGPDEVQGGPVRYANMTFGQGMTMNMLQALAAFGAMVNGGVYYEPQIIYGQIDEEMGLKETTPAIRRSDALSASASEKIRNMLSEARGKSLGRADKPGYTVGGKTGTAQVYDPKTGKYSETNTIGSYLGFGGQTTPEYAIMIRVDDAKLGDFAGSAAAAPIFTDISNWMIDYLKIKPKD